MINIWTQEEEAAHLHARFDELKKQGVGQAEFARDNSIKGGASMVSQYIKGRRPLNMKSATAFAKGFKCALVEISPRLHLEALNAGETISKPEQPTTQNDINLHDDDDVTINQYNVGGSMGNGRLLLEDQPGLIKSWNVDRQWVQMNVKHHTGLGNLCIVTGFGDSMIGMYNPGDPLLVDKGITTCDFDGVYFFRVGIEGYIKRLQRIPGEGILVISENPKYRDWTIKPEMDFQVLAKVVKVWESKQF